MTKFTWLNGYRDTIHVCNCDDISATAEINTINKTVTFYNRHHEPLMTNFDTCNEVPLIEAKKQCEEYLSRIHLDFNLGDIEMTESGIPIMDNHIVGSAGALKGNPQFQKEQEVNKDLEFINKVAIEAMKVCIGTEMQVKDIAIFGEPPKEKMFERVARFSYSQAKAMLAEKKRVEGELLGVENEKLQT